MFVTEPILYLNISILIRHWHNAPSLLFPKSALEEPPKDYRWVSDIYRLKIIPKSVLGIQTSDRTSPKRKKIRYSCFDASQSMQSNCDPPLQNVQISIADVDHISPASRGKLDKFYIMISERVRILTYDYAWPTFMLFIKTNARASVVMSLNLIQNNPIKCNNTCRR